MMKYQFKESYLHKFAKGLLAKWLRKKYLRVDIEKRFYFDGEILFVPDIVCYNKNGIKDIYEVYFKNGMLQGNMKHKEIRIHPTQKPVQLYKWLLINFAKQGDKILDTHFGSLSIGIACHELGFDLTAYEIDKDYFEAGKKRLEIHQMQQKLF